MLLKYNDWRANKDIVYSKREKQDGWKGWWNPSKFKYQMLWWLNHFSGSRDAAQAGTDLPGMHKAPSSIPSFTWTGCGRTPYNPVLRRWRQEHEKVKVHSRRPSLKVQGLPGLQEIHLKNEIEAKCGSNRTLSFYQVGKAGGFTWVQGQPGGLNEF